jgi:hypothetical protein
MAANRVLLWRHGQTDWNVVNRFQGHSDIDLNEVGRFQVQHAAQILAGMKPTMIISSDLGRARDTAQSLADLTGLTVEIDGDLRETNGGLSIQSTTTNTNEIVQGLFDLKLLLIFTKCTNLCNQVVLFLKNDYPIIVTYQIAALGEIKLVLSPTKN